MINIVNKLFNRQIAGKGILQSTCGLWIKVWDEFIRKIVGEIIYIPGNQKGKGESYVLCKFKENYFLTND